MTKTCKVWNHDRTVRKAVVAGSFKDLLKKGKSKLNYPDKESVTIVLEVDGTEVQDDDYFSTLPSNTRFLLLRKDEHWTNDTVAGRVQHQSDDQPDGMIMTDGVPDPTESALMILRQDISKIVTLDRYELQALVDLDQSRLMESLRMSSREVTRIQTTCLRYLDEQKDSQEAMELLHVLSNAKTAPSGSQDDSDITRDFADGRAAAASESSSCTRQSEENGQPETKRLKTS